MVTSYPQSLHPTSRRGTETIRAVHIQGVGRFSSGISSSDVFPDNGASSDPIVGVFLRYLKKNRVKPKALLYSADDAYRFYTVIDSRAAHALDGVFRAEAETQKEILRIEGPDAIRLDFRHRNLAKQGEVDDDFLQHGTFVRLTV